MHPSAISSIRVLHTFGLRGHPCGVRMQNVAMVNWSASPKLHVDFLAAIDRFEMVARLALAEMRLRNCRAETLLLLKNLRRSRSRFVFQRHSGYALEPLSLKDRDSLQLHRDALDALQQLQNKIDEHACVPSSKLPHLVEVLARFPVISVRQLAENAVVSDATAKRWLKAMARATILREVFQNGQNQYVNYELLDIIDRFR